MANSPLALLIVTENVKSLGGGSVAEKNGSSLLERREGSDYQFPSLLTVDKLVVMFLFSGAAAVVLLLNVPAASFVHFRFGFILCFCLLLNCVVPLTLLRNW